MGQLWSSFFDAVVAVGVIVGVPMAALHPTTDILIGVGILLALLAGRITIERTKVRRAQRTQPTA
jgi:hypothetical protein